MIEKIALIAFFTMIIACLILVVIYCITEAKKEKLKDRSKYIEKQYEKWIKKR